MVKTTSVIKRQINLGLYYNSDSDNTLRTSLFRSAVRNERLFPVSNLPLTFCQISIICAL